MMPCAAMPPPRFSEMGESAVLWEADHADAMLLQQKIWAFAAEVGGWPGVRQARPGIGNALVSYDPAAWTCASLAQRMGEAWQADENHDPQYRSVDIPVVYGGELGPDLPEVAQALGFSETELIARHMACEFVVAAVGAMPGFPYLIGLDPALALPRKATPRLQVREGSVVLGGGMSGVITRTSPSGWHMIGYTDMKIFDPLRDPACMLMPGDRVRFVAQEQP